MRPGARVDDIRLAYRGAEGLAIHPDGALEIQTALGALRDAAPVSWQQVAGIRKLVESRYVLESGGAAYSFRVEPAISRNGT